MKVTNLQTSNMDLTNQEESLEVVIKLKPLDHPFHAPPHPPPKGFLHITPHRGFLAGKNYFFSSIGIGVFCGSGST